MEPTGRRTVHIRRAAAMVACTLMGSGPAGAAEFGYSGDHGPGFWGETPEWAACGSGPDPQSRQTPIDIRDVRVDARLRPLDLSLLPAEIALLNKGYTIEQEYANGSYLMLDNALYELLQFHFHSLSEHAVEGNRGVMELHAVFRQSANRLAVVGVIYDIGATSSFLNKLMADGLPRKSGDEVHAHRAINLADGLTDTAGYYTYSGSLTTPPCAQIVTWFVLKKRATLSRAQFEAFNGIMGNNFRPLQPRNGRVVRATRSGGGD